MDHQCIHQYNRKLVYDLKCDKLRSRHKLRDKDLYIYFGYKPFHVGNHYLRHIRAYNRSKDRQSNQVNMYTIQHHFVLYKLYLHHMVTDCKAVKVHHEELR